MGRQVVKQTNGLYSVWSSIVDDFLIEDKTEQEVRDWWESAVLENAKNDMNDAFRNIEKTGTDNWGKTYNEFIKIKRESS
jgi:hypothetical protein